MQLRSHYATPTNKDVVLARCRAATSVASIAGQIRHCMHHKQGDQLAARVPMQHAHPPWPLNNKGWSSPLFSAYDTTGCYS